MPKKILLAEDSLTIQKVFELTFARSDVTITNVDNGEDAVRMARELLPDLVIADLSLPGRTGFDVASALRSSEATKSIPVLVMSGTLVPFDEEAYKRSGARGVVFKPFETQALLDKVHDLMEAPPAEAGGPAGNEAPAGDEPWDFSDVLESMDEESAAKSVPSAAASPAPPPRRDEFLPGGEGTFNPPAADAVSLGEFDVRMEDLDATPAPTAPAEPSLSLAHPVADAEGDELDVLDQFAVLDEIDFAPEGAEATAAAPPEPPPPVAPPPAPPVVPAAAPPSPAPFVAAPDPLAGAFPLEEESLLDEPLLGIESETCGAGEEGVVEAAPVPRPVAAPVAEALPVFAAPPPEPPPPAAAPAAAVPVASPAPFVPPAPASPPPAAAVPPAAAAAQLPADLLQREEFAARVRDAVERSAAEAMERVLWDWMERLSADLKEQVRASVESVAWDVIPRVAESVIRDEIARLSASDDESSPE